MKSSNALLISGFLHLFGLLFVLVAGLFAKAPKPALIQIQIIERNGSPTQAAPVARALPFAPSPKSNSVQNPHSRSMTKSAVPKAVAAHPAVQVNPQLETSNFESDLQTPVSQDQTELQDEDLDQIAAVASAEMAAKNDLPIDDDDSDETAADAEQENQRLAAIARDQSLARQAARTAALAKAQRENIQAAAGPVRSIGQLKQQAGNPRPQYDASDRFAHRQGRVVFLAFISKQGMPSHFQMRKSSGFRELDLKSLKAIRDWKFAPGQEGWVEIPFQWTLEGSPALTGGTLRNQSQN